MVPHAPPTQTSEIARYLSHTLVTNNVRHFSRIPNLDLENWSQ